MSDPTDGAETGSSRRGPEDGNWPGMSIAGIAVLLVGLVLLGRNFGMDVPLPDRWWSIFILLPAATALVLAARSTARMNASRAAWPVPPPADCSCSPWR
jgi:hypothetical protein